MCLLFAKLQKVPQRFSGERMQNCGEEAERGEQEMKILSHIHTFTHSVSRGGVGGGRWRRRSSRRRPSASPQVVKLLGDVLQLRLNGCQAFNLLLLHSVVRTGEMEREGGVIRGSERGGREGGRERLRRRSSTWQFSSASICLKAKPLALWKVSC